MKIRKEKEIQREKKYYKPHYGPEETRDLVEWERNRIKAQKKFIQDSLRAQMENKHTKK
jgi:hypothetical protein